MGATGGCCASGIVAIDIGDGGVIAWSENRFGEIEISADVSVAIKFRQGHEIAGISRSDALLSPLSVVRRAD